jgi:hypothetical protein
VKTRLDFTEVYISASRSDDPFAKSAAGGGIVEDSRESPKAQRLCRLGFELSS